MMDYLPNKDEMDALVQKVFGTDYTIDQMTRLLGGAQKGCYLLTCHNGFSLVLYIWDAQVNYFACTDREPDIFTSNSAALLELNVRFLKAQGVLVPELYYMDRSRCEFPFELAFVEYVDGPMLEPLLDTQEDCTPYLMALRESLDHLYQLKSSKVGHLGHLLPEDFSCHQYIAGHLEESLTYLLENDERIKAWEGAVVKLKTTLYEAISHRKEYTFIHWELGPNHVLLNKEGKPYLIDIEGMKYFDLEYEQSFLRLRFGKHYPLLEQPDLDQNRMRYYQFYHHLACLEGANRLLKLDYYDMEDIQGMLRHNYQQLVELYLT